MSAQPTADRFDAKVHAIVAFACGVIFAIGLGVAGMTSPAKIVAFLDVTSPRWDPSLAFVMVGAIGVHFAFARRAQAAAEAGRSPIGAACYRLPTRGRIDAPLVAGAALFGIGWGLGGYCPGPAIVAFVVTPTSVVFVGAMLAGMWLTHVVRERMAERASDRERARELERELAR